MNKDVLCILYVHIFSYLICLGRVALQPKLFFKGPFQVLMFENCVDVLKGPAVADKETSLAMKLVTSNGCSRAEG